MRRLLGRKVLTTRYYEHAEKLRVPFVYPIWLLYRVAFASMPYLCELSTVLVLSTCPSFLSTQGNKRQTPNGLEVILARNIIHNILVSRQTIVVKVTNTTPIQTKLSVPGIEGTQSICGNVVRAAGTYGSQMTGVLSLLQGRKCVTANICMTLPTTLRV